MWICKTTIDNEGNVTTESHLLVPSRTYRAGRGSALEFHYDFAKGMSRVSFEFRMGSVDAGSIEDPKGKELEHPNRPHYTFKLFNGNKKEIEVERRIGGTEPLASKKDTLVQDGDKIVVQNDAVSWVFEFVWRSCFVSIRDPRIMKQKINALGPLGVRIGSNFRHYHSHYVADTLETKPSILTALMHVKHVVSLDWLDALQKNGASAHHRTLSPPESEEEFAERLKKLADKPSGDDKLGLSKLEKDFVGSWVSEKDYLPPLSREVVDGGYSDPKTWLANERRRTMFEGFLVVAFEFDLGFTDTVIELVVLGGGKTLLIDLKVTPNMSGGEIASKIKQSMATNKVRNHPGRLLLLRPDHVDDYANIEAAANILSVPRLIAPDEVAIAVYQLTTEIFANPQEDPARFMSQASPEEAAPPAISKRRVLAPASSGIESHFPESVPFSNNVPPPDPTPSVPASSQIDIVASQGREPPALSQDLPTPQPSRRRFTRIEIPEQDYLDDIFTSGIPPAGESQSERVPRRGTNSMELDSQAGDAPAEESAPKPSATTRSSRFKRQLPSDMDDLFSFGASASTSPLKASKRARKETESQISGINMDIDGDFDSQSQAPPRPGQSSRRLTSVDEDEEVSQALTSSGSKKRRTGDLNDEEMAYGDPERGTSSKKTRLGEGDDAEDGSDDDLPASRRRATQSKTGKKKTTTSSTQDDAKKEDLFLRVNTGRRKLGADDQQFNEEFNKLRIVRPAALRKPNEKMSGKIGWADKGLDDEELREMKEWNPDASKSFFQIKFMPVVRKERDEINDGLDVPDQWKGLPNFKAFRPKNAAAPERPRSRKVELVLSEPMNDFGLGDAYDKGGQRTTISMSQSQSESSHSQLAKSSSSKSKGKAKSSRKTREATATIQEDDEDDDEPAPIFSRLTDDGDSSQTVRGRTPTVTSQPPATRTNTRAAKKNQAPVLVEDSDDSDEMMFPGFNGTSRGGKSTGKKRKR